MCLRLNNSEVPAAMHQAHQVQHAVVVTLFAARHRSVPELFDERLGNCTIGRGQAAYGRGCQHSCGVARRERLAVEGVTVDEAFNALVKKELLDAIAERGFALVLMPP